MSVNHIPDKRTYAFHQKAAEILRASPDRLVEVNDVLSHWRTMSGTQAEGWAEKWQELIKDLSAAEIADLICKQGEEMDFYRKSSPFACLLSDEQRMKIIRRFKYDHE
ncbi:hypothetical protein TERTU_2389 [Teredinibacter turnerae T7901]|uniref:Uncharacterized protein n=1 Tax=Teredinibacter turnerae (strain ATCC 39867 / T7901) TaxID=377629 RepID=C5BKC5_TERTT|nr:hypothetical protein [Teredinibacter turnerae]ACR11535.1 hypothetical protein TERTU_2389 [Teredinibacter turnerae T7901]